VTAFESEFAAMCGSAHAIAFSNATTALHAAVLAGGIGPGDRVLTSPNTFLSSANCAAFAGATPDFVDIDPVSHNLDPAALEAAWTDDVKAVIPVAYAGQLAWSQAGTGSQVAEKCILFPPIDPPAAPTPA
jgi:dTDP-4-amino-4,6-dideoxygalactose transaminase